MLVFYLLLTELQWWSCSPASQRLQRAPGTPETSLRRLNLVRNTKTASLNPLAEGLSGDGAMGLQRSSLQERLGEPFPDCPNPICCHFDLSLCWWVKNAAGGVFLEIRSSILLQRVSSCLGNKLGPRAATALPFALCSTLPDQDWGSNSWE